MGATCIGKRSPDGLICLECADISAPGAGLSDLTFDDITTEDDTSCLQCAHWIVPVAIRVLRRTGADVGRCLNCWQPVPPGVVVCLRCEVGGGWI